MSYLNKCYLLERNLVLDLISDTIEIKIKFIERGILCHLYLEISHVLLQITVYDIFRDEPIVWESSQVLKNIFLRWSITISYYFFGNNYIYIIHLCIVSLWLSGFDNYRIIKLFSCIIYWILKYVHYVLIWCIWWYQISNIKILHKTSYWS